MASEGKKALVAGATGLVGKQLLRQLLQDERYGSVVALVRKPLPFQHPKLVTATIEYDRLESGEYRFEADDWFCSLGTTIRIAKTQEAFRRVDYTYPLALGRMAAGTGAMNFGLVSAVGSSAKSRIFYSRVKGELERDLAALGLKRLHLFRPSLLLGEREEYGSGERAIGAVMKAIGPLLGGPLSKYRAVQDKTVASAMIEAANRGSEPGVHVYEGNTMFRLARS